MTVIDCKKIADSWLEDIEKQVDTFYENNHRFPKIVTIIANEDSASERYVRNKMKTCERVGIQHEEIYYKEKNENTLINIIEQLNIDTNIDGIMLQMPVFSCINAKKVIDKIDPKKDIDCLTSSNIGKLALNTSFFMPATVAGIMYLLEYCKVELSGQSVLIRGRSDIVGKPLALVMINAGATVEVRNSHSQSYSYEDSSRYDIVIDATGQENTHNEKWYCNYYIDVTTLIKNNKLCGSLKNFYAPRYFTPVPKGIGLLTCAGLAANVMKLINN